MEVFSSMNGEFLFLLTLQCNSKINSCRFCAMSLLILFLLIPEVPIRMTTIISHLVRESFPNVNQTPLDERIGDRRDGLYRISLGVLSIKKTYTWQERSQGALMRLGSPLNPFRPATRRQQAKRVFSIYSLLLSYRDQFFTAEFFKNSVPPYGKIVVV